MLKGGRTLEIPVGIGELLKVVEARFRTYKQVVRGSKRDNALQVSHPNKPENGIGFRLEGYFCRLRLFRFGEPFHGGG